MGAVSAPLVVQILARAEPVIANAVTHYQRVLRRVQWVDRDDLVQHAKIAAIEAHCTFDAKKNVKLETWMGRVIRARLHDLATSILDPTEIVYTAHRKKMPEGEINELRQRVRNVTSPAVSIEAQQRATTPRGGSGEAQLAMEMVMPNDDEVSPEDAALSAGHARKVFAVADEVLTTHERLVFHAELAGTSGETIARRLGVSKQAVGATRKRAFGRIRAALAG